MLTEVTCTLHTAHSYSVVVRLCYTNISNLSQMLPTAGPIASFSARQWMDRSLLLKEPVAQSVRYTNPILSYDAKPICKVKKEGCA